GGLLITRITLNRTRLTWEPALPAILRQGELWRLITPALVHFKTAALLLNLMWWIDLGSSIEARQGTGRLAILFLTIAVGSNLVQTWVGGPAFCGISGVV